MIDIENQVYTPLATGLRATFQGIYVTGIYVKSPASFPAVSVVERDNYTSAAFMDNCPDERYATITYEVNVYSNKAQTKKSECKAIMGYIDDYMYHHNFRRTAQSPVPNMDDASIYRMVARYTAITDGTNIYRR